MGEGRDISGSDYHHHVFEYLVHDFPRTKYICMYLYLYVYALASTLTVFINPLHLSTFQCQSASNFTRLLQLTVVRYRQY